MGDKDYSNVDREVARELMRFGEMQLHAQLTIAIASDQRASMMCGVLVTSMLACFGAAGVSYNAGLTVFLVATLFAGVALLVAILACIKAFWPGMIYLPGTQPKQWLGEDVLYGCLVDTMVHQSTRYQEMIDSNELKNALAAKWLKRGILVAVSSPAIGAIASTVYLISIHYLPGLGCEGGVGRG